MNVGVAKTIHWPEIDILISTPQNLMNYLQFYSKFTGVLKPELMVIDEADLLL